MINMLRKYYAIIFVFSVFAFVISPIFACNDSLHNWRGENIIGDSDMSVESFNLLFEEICKRNPELKKPTWIVSLTENPISDFSRKSLKCSISDFFPERNFEYSDEIPMNRSSLSLVASSASGIIWLDFMFQIANDYDDFDKNFMLVRTGRREIATVRVLAMASSGKIPFVEELKIINEYHFDQIVNFDFLTGGAAFFRFSFLKTPMEEFFDVKFYQLKFNVSR
ncbi:MAG: hypothetical protein HQM10_09705 [Candidatus Riflebacteria bacterium]|nr:hypothetical protein [Candidatus Riflebacteria bacterium]